MSEGLVVVCSVLGDYQRTVKVLGLYGNKLRVQWDSLDEGLDISLSNGRFMGARLNKKFRLSDEALEHWRGRARAEGTKIHVTPAPGRKRGRPKKPKPRDPRQTNFEDLLDK